MDSSYVVQALKNIDILEIIFANMELDDLKNLRHVCRLWSIEATRGFRNKILIHHNYSLVGKLNPINIAEFLLQNEITYGLTTSFLNYSWYACKREDPTRWKTILYKKYLNQRNNRKYLKILSTSLFQRSSAAYLTECRIELNVFHESDSDLLVNILSKTVNLETLAIDFVLVKKTEVKALPDKLLVPLNKLKLLALRSGYTCSPESKSEPFDVECWGKILALFPGIKFLDLASWEQYYSSDFEFERLELCRQAVQSLYLQKQYFQSLEGLRFERRMWNEGSLLPFPRLKYLKIERSEFDHKMIFPMLSYHSPILKRCELYLTHYIIEDPREINFNLSSLPVLEYLGLFASPFTDDENYDITKSDILNIRNMISGGEEAFKYIFPSLHTLNIAFDDMNEEFFNYIFPKEVAIEIHGMLSFGISLCADCESEEITRFYSIFPDLQVFKHVREETDYFVVCVHKKDNYDKKLYPLRNNFSKLWKTLSTRRIYDLLRGNFYEEPFLCKIFPLNRLYKPDDKEIEAILTETRRKRCSIT